MQAFKRFSVPSGTSPPAPGSIQAGELYFREDVGDLLLGLSKMQLTPLALLDKTQTFTASQFFSGPVRFDGTADFGGSFALFVPHQSSDPLPHEGAIHWNTRTRELHVGDGDVPVLVGGEDVPRAGRGLRYSTGTGGHRELSLDRQALIPEIAPGGGLQLTQDELAVDGAVVALLGWPQVYSARPEFAAGVSVSSDAIHLSGGARILGALIPRAPDEVASRRYVDSMAQGLTPIAAVRLATDEPLPEHDALAGELFASDPGALFIDGQSVSRNDRILVLHTEERGVYVCAASRV